MTKVFDGQAVDGASLEVFLPASGGVVMLNGNFGGGTVTAQLKTPDGLNHLDIDGESYTTAGAFPIMINAPGVVRLDLTGSTTPSLDAWIEADEPHTRVEVRSR